MPIRAHAAGSLVSPHLASGRMRGGCAAVVSARTGDVIVGAARDRYRVYALDEFLADGFRDASSASPTAIVAGRSRGARHGSRLVGVAVLVAAAAGTVAGLIATNGLSHVNGASRGGAAQVAAVARSFASRSRHDGRTSNRRLGSARQSSRARASTRAARPLAAADSLAHDADRRSSPRASRRYGRRRSQPDPAAANERLVAAERLSVERPAAERRAAPAASRPAPTQPMLVAATTATVASKRSPEFGFER
jgi:hypothetical protein